MNKIPVIIPILFLTVVANLMTTSTVNAADAAEEKDYTVKIMKTEWIAHNGDYRIMGLSPDGKSFYSYKKGDGGNYNLFRHDSATGSVVKTINLEKHCRPEKTILSWSPDGRYFSLYSWGRYPYGMRIMRGGYVFYVDTATDSVTAVSGERSIKNILWEQGSICYNAVFSSDGRYILYNSWMTNSCDVMRTKLEKEGDSTIVYTTPKHEESLFNDLLYLSDGYILRNYDPNIITRPKRLMLVDLKTKKENEIDRLTVDDNKYGVFQIKDFSKDRKIVLVNVWRHNIDDPGSYYHEMQILDFSEEYDNPEKTRLTTTKGLHVKNGILSRNGNYVIYVEGALNDANSDRLVSYDRISKRYTLLFSNKAYQALTGKTPLNNLGGYAFPSFDTNGGLFVSEKDDLLVWHATGYFIINLSDIIAFHEIKKTI